MTSTIPAPKSAHPDAAWIKAVDELTAYLQSLQAYDVTPWLEVLS